MHLVGSCTHSSTHTFTHTCDTHTAHRPILDPATTLNSSILQHPHACTTSHQHSAAGGCRAAGGVVYSSHPFLFSQVCRCRFVIPIMYHILPIMYRSIPRMYDSIHNPPPPPPPPPPPHHPPHFHREQWQVGAREDWRFTSMAVWLGRHWWWASFWLAYVSQQVCLPCAHASCTVHVHTQHTRCISMSTYNTCTHTYVHTQHMYTHNTCTHTSRQCLWV